MLTLGMFIAGLLALVAGAELLVRGASKLALSFGISPLVVGLTIVAFGTSAPEMAVSTGAVLNGQGDIAIGNVVGSNIFNVLFILGASALIVPLVVHVQLIRQEIPIMLGASMLLLAFAPNWIVTLAGGVILGVAQGLGAAIDPGWQILAGHVAFLLILAIKPRGLFPRMDG